MTPPPFLAYYPPPTAGRINMTDTPESLDLDDDDQIDVRAHPLHCLL